MSEQTLSRRARLRAETTAEIHAIALQLLAKGGPDAISLRAIAREMGMSGSAIYSYFDTRDALITTLINDIYTSLMDQVEAARDALPPDDVAGRIVAWGQAVREWSLANPEGFRLIYGDPVPGYHAPDTGPAPEATKRACLGLGQLAATAWPYAEDHQHRRHRWSDFPATAVAEFRSVYPGLPPEAFALALRIWGRMHGLICLEIYGHLGQQTNEPAKLYLIEMLDLVRSLGLDPDSVTAR